MITQYVVHCVTTATPMPEKNNILQKNKFVIPILQVFDDKIPPNMLAGVFKFSNFDGQVSASGSDSVPKLILFGGRVKWIEAVEIILWPPLFFPW